MNIFSKMFGKKRGSEKTEIETETNQPQKAPVAWETIANPSDADFAEVRTEAVETVPQRTTETDEACRLTGGLYAELYNRVVGLSSLGLIKSRLEELISSGAKRIADVYKQETEAAAKTFEDMCLPHVQDVADQKVAAIARVEELRKDNSRLESEYLAYAMQLTGNPGIKVPEVDKRWLVAISTLVGLIVLICDAFMGARAFSFGSNDVLAYSMSFAFGFSYGAVLYFWAIAAKRLESYGDALRNLAAYKRQNSRNAQAQSLELFAISDSERATVRSMKLIFWAMSIALLIARVVVSRESSTVLSVGILSTFMIVVVSLVGFYFEKQIAPPYGKHHDHLDELAAQMEENDEEIDLILNPDTEEEPEWLSRAKTAYFSAMNSAWTKVEDEVAEAHGAVTNYRTLIGQCSKLSDIIREQHIGTCHEVIGKVLMMCAEREGLEKIDFHFDRQHAASFLVLPAINDPFTGQIESGAFNPDNLKPAKVPAEPNKLLQNVIANSPKPPDPPKRRKPVVNMTQNS